MGTADEGSFLELLIANERILQWADELDKYKNETSKLKATLKDLVGALQNNAAYVEEAQNAGIVPKLTKILKNQAVHCDDEISEQISSIITLCSGPMAIGGRVCTVNYQGTPVVVKEGALGDGVGAKVWTAAHTLSLELASNPEIVKEKSVLEIGSGCGACGFLAAKLGARQVVLTDYVDQLLLNLRDALHLNGFGECRITQGADSLDGDHNDAEDNDQYTAEVKQSPQTVSLTTESKANAWNCGHVAVRFIDWIDSLEWVNDKLLRKDNARFGSSCNQSCKGLQRPDSQASLASSRSSSYSALDGMSSRSIAPGVSSNKKFDVVLGTDILYEWQMTETVAATICHRLKPGGLALVCNAIRDQAMFDEMIRNMRRFGLHVGITPIQPQLNDASICHYDQEYEGGFVLVACEHSSYPASSWYRNDLFSNHL